MKKKGALNVSVGTIIVVVIGVALLGVGLMFVTGLGDNLMDLMEGIFGGGGLVKIPKQPTGTDPLAYEGSISLKRGNTKNVEAAIFNNLGVAANFEISIEPSGTFKDLDPEELVVGLDLTEESVGPDEKQTFQVIVQAKGHSRSGTNSYKLVVTANGVEYATGPFIVDVEIE